MKIILRKMGECENQGVFERNLKAWSKIKKKSLATWDGPVSGHDELGHAAWQTR